VQNIIKQSAHVVVGVVVVVLSHRNVIMSFFVIFCEVA
jgi:hypothetical protein